MTIRDRGEPRILEELKNHPKTLQPQTVTLSELTPGRHVDTVVKVAAVRSKEREDDLGFRTCIIGVAEDSTFKVPFVCYKPYHTFFKDSVFRFEGAYVHEFEDHSVLIVLTEYSRINYLPEEDPEKYAWKPRIGCINRPLGRFVVTLEGVVSKVYDSSGLVKRCEKCNRVISGERCPKCGEAGWFWSVRISTRLSSSTGSINAIFPQHLACKILGRSVSEILWMADVSGGLRNGDYGTEVFHIKPPEKLTIKESTVVEPAAFKRCEKLIVPDHKHSKIYYPTNVRVDSKQTLDVKDRLLDYSAEEDKALYEKILEKALDIEVRMKTGLPKIHGIYLTEQSIPLYWTEKAELYLGFEMQVSAEPHSLKVEFSPASLVRESVLEYVEWRRSRGASAKSIERCLLEWRRNVILAPNGTLGKIDKVMYRDAGDFKVPDLNIPLPEFWRTAYDIRVEEDEKPLLVVKPYNMDLELTYPPSCAFYDEQTIRVRSSILNYVKAKKSTLRKTVSNLSRNLMESLKIGSWKVESAVDENPRINVQRMILQEAGKKVLGRRVKACGSVIQADGQLYFIPKNLEVS